MSEGTFREQLRRDLHAAAVLPDGGSLADTSAADQGVLRHVLCTSPHHLHPAQQRAHHGTGQVGDSRMLWVFPLNVLLSIFRDILRDRKELKDL